MKPYIICHMVASIDGRIDCSMVDKISGDEYYTTLDALGCPSHIEGRVTMAHYTALEEPFCAVDETPIGRAETYVAEKSERYTVAVDTHGRLAWPSRQSLDAPLVVITSQKAPEAYLEALRAQGHSYIVAGEDTIDLPRAMDVLGDSFGVSRLALLGGGHINGGFLAEGLIDEVSLLLAPGIDGRKGQTALFDGMENRPDFLPTKLSLQSVERLDGDVIWLRYRVG